jgi:hypothetical protein
VVQASGQANETVSQTGCGIPRILTCTQCKIKTKPMKRIKLHPHNPTLVFSMAFGWMLFLPYAKLNGPMKISPQQAARYFADPAVPLICVETIV